MSRDERLALAIAVMVSLAGFLVASFVGGAIVPRVVPL